MTTVNSARGKLKNVKVTAADVVIQPPVKDAYAVVSVRMSGSEFDLLDRAAEKSGKKMSTFIREAAVERAKENMAK